MGRRGYFSCSGESAVAACDPYNWDCKKVTTATPTAAHGSTDIKIRTFSYSELVAATDSFSAECFLGKGSHGSVYRAFLDGGKLVAAVKRTKIPASSTGGPAENEIEILSRVRSPRLVNLIGFCNDSVEERLLVVEYMANGCFYDLLHRSSRPPGWTKRIGFALQIAKAVRALHGSDPPVIHRDIKSSNVLIDERGKARLSDFGLALRGHVEDVRVRCTPPAGTLGYLDPSYLAPADLSAKSDVFSFGILLLEIISGRKAIDVNYSPPSIVDWAVPLIRRLQFGEICDIRVEAPADIDVVREAAVLAARCVRADAGKRPDMVEVVERLKDVLEKVKAGRIWGHLRRRVVRVEIGEQPDAAELGPSAETWRVKRVGSGRRYRKVSSVSNSNVVSKKQELGAPGAASERGPARTMTNEIVVRSKSVGSGTGSTRRRHAGNVVAVNRPVAMMMRLNKSRSTGGLQGLWTLDCYRELVAFGSGDHPASPGGSERRNRIISLADDDDDEKKLLEKPLVTQDPKVD